MAPTLLAGDQVIVNRLAYVARLPFGGGPLRQMGSPQRGEVVVFAYPFQDDSMYVGRAMIKRVVGIPGDRLRMKDNVWWINGVATPRRVIARPVACGTDARASCELASEELAGKIFHTWRRVSAFAGQRVDGSSQPVNDAKWPPGIFDPTRVKVTARCFAPPQNRDYPDFVVPPDRLLVVGDNRDASQDGRYFGLVPVAAVEGRAERVWISRVSGDWLPRWSRIGLPVAFAGAQQ